MIVKGVLKSFDEVSYSATVHPHGSMGVALENVPVARNIPVVEMVEDRYVILHFFDRTNPEDCVVMGVYV